MKNNDLINRNYLYLFALITLSLLIWSCDNNVSVKKKNYEISEDLRNMIWKIHSDASTSMMKRNYAETLNLFNDSIAKYCKNINCDSVFSDLRYCLLEYPYHAQNMYYQKNLFRNSKVEVLFEDLEFKPFIMEYISVNKETAITTGLSGNKHIMHLLTSIYSNYNGEWKVDAMTVHLYSVDNKDAVDWLSEGERWLKEKDYVMSSYCIRMCNNLIKPANMIGHYKNEPLILDRMKKVNNVISRNLDFFNLTNSIKTKPSISDVLPIIMNKKVYPVIAYETNLSLKDTVSIEKECKQLDPIFKDLFKNIVNDTIVVQILPVTDSWSKPDTYILKKRKLLK